ncbi:MAG: ribonuclease III [Myxococcota bacterium]|jgi:ribonuclease-3
MAVENAEDTLADLVDRIGHSFRDHELIEKALVHRSWVNEMRLDRSSSNERLEFLGDAVLNLAVSHELMKHMGDAMEGVLSRVRAALVNKNRLGELARTLGIGPHMKLGRGEVSSGGGDKLSILADSYEAIIGAVFLDGGFPAALRAIKKHFGSALTGGEIPSDEMDYKSRLQQTAQTAYKAAPAYFVIGESGPDHEKIFKVEVKVLGERMGTGVGRSKREAEQMAAKVAEPALRERLAEAKQCTGVQPEHGGEDRDMTGKVVKGPLPVPAMSAEEAFFFEMDDISAVNTDVAVSAQPGGFEVEVVKKAPKKKAAKPPAEKAKPRAKAKKKGRTIILKKAVKV